MAFWGSLCCVAAAECAPCLRLHLCGSCRTLLRTPSLTTTAPLYLVLLHHAEVASAAPPGEAWRGRPRVAATVRLFSPSFFRKVITRHDTGMGESYMDGDYEVCVGGEGGGVRAGE